MHMPTTYPTVAEALAHTRHIDERTIDAVKIWKSLFWKGWNKQEPAWQFAGLLWLVTAVCRVEGVCPIDIDIGKDYLYVPREETPLIIFGATPSVISTLHEIGHHLFGKSELEACAFSLQLFKEVFPKDFAKLHADGHMMKL